MSDINQWKIAEGIQCAGQWLYFSGDDTTKS